MTRLAMLSFWHVHAGDYARQTQEHPRAELVACWDEDAERGREQAERYGLRYHAELDDLLSADDIDGVVVDTPTDMHPEVIGKAARAGKHVFTEKVLALTGAECERILAEVRAAGVTVVVSLPRLYEGYTLAISGLLAAGDLGEVTLVRTRLSHNGALGEAWLPDRFFEARHCGGGALVDLGCHPMYLARHFLGRMPDDVSATFGHVTGREVEDNAVATLRCNNGALGVVEAGFVNPHSPFSIEVHGTEGSALYGLPEPKVLLRSNNRDRDNWVPVSAPFDRPTPFDQFISHLEAGTTADDNVAAAVDLTRLMEAANSSAASNASIRVK